MTEIKPIPVGYNLIDGAVINALINATNASSSVFNVKSEAYGAKGDGETNDTVAIQAAIDAAALVNGTIYLPRGRYYVPNTGQLVFADSDVTILGDGMYESVIVFNDSAQTTTRRDCLTTFTGFPVGNVTFKNFGIESDWGVGNYTERSHLCQMTVTGRVRLENCHFSGSRYMSTIFGNATSALVTGCVYENGKRDGCRFKDCKNVTITNNYFYRIIDDSIAVHTNDTTPGPIEKGVVISNNEIVDGQGIAVLGAKQVKISDNVIQRVQTRAIELGIGLSTEGNTAPLCISVTDNIITDVFNGFLLSPTSGAGGTVRWIYISNSVPTPDNGHYIGQDNGAGGVVAPWDYFYTNNTDVNPNPGNWFITISGNQCVRTLDAVAAYSDYGYGERLTGTGFTDPAITLGIPGTGVIGGNQIEILNHGWNVVIENNKLWGASSYGVYLNGTPASAYVSWKNVLISGNSIANFTDTGVFYEGVGIVEVSDNNVDGDPLFVDPERGPGGTWSVSLPTHYAFRDNGTVRASVKNNRVRNCGRFIGGSGEDSYEGNILYCNPHAIGDDVNNVGIRYIGEPSKYGSVQIEDGDPGSTTYGQLLNACELAAAAMPSSGKYAAGHFIRNTSSSLNEPFGWLRITTGSNHVLGTDWLALATLSADASNVVSIKDTQFLLVDDVDTTKKAAFQCSSVTAGTTRTMTVPNGNGTLLFQAGGITSNRLIRGHDGVAVKVSNAATIDDLDNIAVVSSISFAEEAKTSAGALTLSKVYHSLSNSSGSSYAVTLAAPTSVQLGIIKEIEMITGDGTNTVTLALTNVNGGSAATTCTWNAAGQKLIVMAGASKWTVIKEFGVTLT